MDVKMLRISTVMLAFFIAGCQQTAPSQLTPSYSLSNAPQTSATAPKFQWPATGRVVNGFSPDTQGINISARIGTPVLASADGKVIYAGSGAAGFGNLIIIDHGNGYVTSYAHNNRILVAALENVKAGQQVGEVGQTATDSPKLNFRIKQQSTWVDPIAFLPSKKELVKTAAVADRDTCKNYGFKQNTSAFAECMMRIDLARREMMQQQQAYEQQLFQYEQQVAAQNSARKRQQSAYMTELGARMLGGQAPLDAALSVGTGAPITQPQMPSTTRLYTLPNGRSMTCTTSGNVVNCF